MEKFEAQWQQVIQFFKQRFTDGETPQMDTILFLIGVQELGMIKPKFTKDEKLNLMHVATCKLLEPYGYYEFSHFDDDGWSHYNKENDIEEMSPQEQEELMKEAIINYFDDNKLI
jgi:hypothetical protein